MNRRDFLRRSATSAVAFGILRDAAACRSAPRDGVPGNAPKPGAAFVSLRDRYFLRVLQLNPVTSTYLGGDGYSPALREVNGKLRDYSITALEGERRFYVSVERELAQIDPKALSPAERVDHQVLSAQLAFMLHQIRELRYFERAVDTYVAEPFRGIDWQLQQMRELPGGRRGTDEEWQLVVARLRAIPAYLDTARSNLATGIKTGNIPDRRMVERDGIGGSRANIEYFKTTLPKLAREFLGDRPTGALLRSRLDAAAASAAQSYGAFANFLERSFDMKEKVDRFTIGEREYEWRVRNNLRVARSAAELYHYGGEQVARYEREIFDVARQIAKEAKLALRFDTAAAQRAGVRAVMNYLSKESPKNDDELFRWYREVGARAVAYGRARGLFNIPATYRLDVMPTPPVLRSTIDAAYYPAPPFKKSGVGRFYLTPTGNDPAALALNNRASVADTAVHEGFPGHDWHYKFMTQHAAEISNIRWLTPGAVEDSSSMWEDSMAAEGWALYAEELMAEPAPGRPYGFYTPSEYLYELQGQLLRAVRIVVDVGIHTGRMSYDQAVDYFTEHVSFYPNACARIDADPAAKAVCDQAQRAIYRYSKWPTQAITYNLGKAGIIELRGAYKFKIGGRYSQKAFHEKLMKMGTIPVGHFWDAFMEESPSAG